MISRVRALVAAAVGVGAGIVVLALRRSRREAATTLEPREANYGADDVAPSRSHDATKNELYAEAKRRGIKGRSKMTKAQIETALTKEN